MKVKSVKKTEMTRRRLPISLRPSLSGSLSLKGPTMRPRRRYLSSRVNSTLSARCLSMSQSRADSILRRASCRLRPKMRCSPTPEASLCCVWRLKKFKSTLLNCKAKSRPKSSMTLRRNRSMKGSMPVLSLRQNSPSRLECWASFRSTLQ